jgi:hypothetical protein
MCRVCQGWKSDEMDGWTHIVSNPANKYPWCGCAWTRYRGRWWAGYTCEKCTKCFFRKLDPTKDGCVRIVDIYGNVQTLTKWVDVRDIDHVESEANHMGVLIVPHSPDMREFLIFAALDL